MERSARFALAVVVLGLAPTLLMRVEPVGAASGRQSTQSHVCIFNHSLLWTTAGKCRPRAASYPAAIKGRVRRAIYDSALTFGVPYAVLLKIAQCESSLNPHASNGTHFGLFQFLPETFHRGTQQMIQMTGITAHTFWNPRDASYVAGFLFAVGEAPAWSCEPPLPPMPP